MKSSVYRVSSGVCGNIAAAWVILLFGSPFIPSLDALDLTRSLVFAMVFMALATLFDKLSL